MNLKEQQVKGEFHIILMGLMEELGYPIKGVLGLCDSYSDVIRQAFFDEQLVNYSEIIAYINEEFQYSDLKKIAVKLKNQDHQAHTDEDKKIIQVLDFFDEIAFQKTKQIASRLFNHSSSAQEKSVEPDRLITEAFPAIGGYEEFNLYFKQLHNKILNTGITLSINITAGYIANNQSKHLFESHVIEICYNHITKKWALVDINQPDISERSATLEDICKFISNALTILNDKRFELFHINLFSVNSNKILLQQISSEIKKLIKLEAPSNSTMGLDVQQKELLQELSKEGLKADHLRKWQSNDGYFTSDHRDAFIFLIRKKSFSFEQAIEEISDLDRNQVSGITLGFKKEDLVELDRIQILALTRLSKFGVTSNCLRCWKSLYGNFLTYEHIDALQYLLQKGYKLEEIINKVRNLNVDQASLIGWSGKWPDGEEIIPLSKECAVEIMVLNPDPDVHHHRKGVHENLWIKERFGKDNYLSIGVFLKEDTSELQFYFFEDCDKSPHPDFFPSLKELQRYLPPEKKDVFDRTHKVYLMGHGDSESKYGFGNYHAHDNFNHPPDDTEQIYDDKFDELIQDILRTIHAQNDKIGITLEACHADNLVTAEKAGYTKSFLERLSAKYPRVTFSGTGPWSDSKDLQESLATDSRASGGYPDLNAPITSMGGGIWKHGNTVIFHHNDNQIAVKKSPFASTETAKNLKINTVNYAREILDQQARLNSHEREAIITKICANRKILKIEDLKYEPDFPHQAESENKEIKYNEKIILKQEQDRYLKRVYKILLQDKYSNRDVLIIALGLNHSFIFNGHDDVLQKILAKEDLLKLVMVSCGKVLLASQDNNNVIDLLVKKEIPINSVDDKGMTALHYAANNFYVYRAEPINLVKKLLDCGANIEARDKRGRTPLMLATEQSQKGTVIAGGNLLALLQQKLASAALVKSDTIESKRTTSHTAILRSLGQKPGLTAQTEPSDTPAATLPDKAPLDAKKTVEIEQQKQHAPSTEKEEVENQAPSPKI